MGFEDFLDPKSVAVVGASRHQGRVGYEVLANLVKSGYGGAIYPVNPNADTLQGLKCYPDIVSIGQTPELVVVVVAAKRTPQVMEQCARVGTKCVIIITAGFKETGSEGEKLQARLLQIAKRAGIRILGPNSLGVLVPARKLNASFGGDLPAAGSVGYISQSGALLAAIIDIANATGTGFSIMVSIGNKADIDELDVLRVLGNDQATGVIAGYLESINDGNAFVREAERISRDKPILLVKSGITSAGARAVRSHTGSLAGTDAAYECVFERAGIIRCDSIKSQLNYARAFTGRSLPKGRRVAIVTNAGGAGIMAADYVERQGLVMAEFSQQTLKRLSAVLPTAASLHNPVDILCDALADRYALALQAVLDDANVDMVLVLMTPQAMTQAAATARSVVELWRQTDKLILASFLGARKVQEGACILQRAGVPYYDSPEEAVAAARIVAQYVDWRNRPRRVVRYFPVNRRKVETILDKHKRRGSTQIGEIEAKEILEAYGFAVPTAAVATTAEQAANIAEEIGFPVALKIWSPEIIHKMDVGGVKLGLKTGQEVMDAFDLMMYRIPKLAPQANILGVVVQEMISRGKEVILGMYRDPQCGPVMMFGMGGTMVEVLSDVSFYLAPLTAEEARQMLVATKTYRMLRGLRGEQPVDIDAIAEALQRLSQLATEFPQIQQMDINPFAVGPKGTTPVAVDARISLETGQS